MKTMKMMTMMIYPLVNVYKTDGKITIIHGKTHYFYGHFQKQTICFPEVRVLNQHVEGGITAPTKISAGVLKLQLFEYSYSIFPQIG
jgi:hypothetical protein